MHDSQNDPRSRKSRHELTPANLSSTIHFTEIPLHWNKATFTSVVTGSGFIVSVKLKYFKNEEVDSENENGNGNDIDASKNADDGEGEGQGDRTGIEWIDVDYRNASTANRALNSLNKIRNFPCKMSVIIPEKWEAKMEREAELKPMEFTRDSFPWNDRLELPFEMVSEVPLPRRPAPVVQTTASTGDSSSSSTTSTTTSQNNTASTNAASDNLASKANETPANQIQFPDILARASKHLPAYQPGSMTAPDIVSQNLSKIPTLQMIEILSNLKILANQQNKMQQLEQFLKTNIDLTVAVTQAMLEMGLINYHVTTNVLQSMSHAPLQSPPPPPVPAQPQPQPQPQQMMMHPTDSNSNNNANQTPILEQAVPVQPVASMPAPALAPAPAPAPAPATGPRFNEQKLALLPQDQQNMIRTALQMSINNIAALPPDQQKLIQQLRNDYLL